MALHEVKTPIPGVFYRRPSPDQPEYAAPGDSVAAGQTIGHLHIHLIPRYAGDQPDPRGGVRWIFPDKADYWTARADPSRP